MYNYLHDNYNNTWFHDEVMAPYFGPTQGRKVIGERIIFWIILPVVLNSLFFMWLLTTCLCKCCCKGCCKCCCGGSKSQDTSDTKASKKDGPASAEAEKKELEAKKAKEVLQ